MSLSHSSTSRRHLSRRLLLVSAAGLVATFLLLTAAPRPISAEGEAIAGQVPVPGASRVMVASAGADTEAMVAQLKERACYAPQLWMEASGRWASYTDGAPAFVNARFPSTLAQASAVVVRCASEVDVVVQHGDVTLAGTLTLPAAPPPYPATILVSGSGPQDRDEAIPGLDGYRPFRWLAEGLQGAGVAALRYDDRGVAGSTGVHLTATTADFADDAEAVLDHLRQLPGIDPVRVGITGHSEGGIVAAMVAARRSDVAFVVSIAGTGMDGGSLLRLQSELILNQLGLPAEVVEQELATGDRIRQLIIDEDWDALETLIRETAAVQLAALPPETRDAIDLDALVMQQMASYQTWMRFFILHDPAEDWRRVTVPVLALFGGRDLQVPAAENRVPVEAALQEAGNADVTVLLFEEANHLFQQAVTGSPEEYPVLKMEFLPGFLDAITGWLQERFVD